MNRLRHLATVTGCTPSSAPTAVFEPPSAHASTIRHRKASACEDVARRDQRSSVSRSSGEGKSGAHTDTYHGHFARLVPDELVIEVIEFETEDAALHGTMTMTTSLTAVDGGTDVVVVHEGIPDVVPREDNETGTRMALDHLARLVEGAGVE